MTPAALTKSTSRPTLFTMIGRYWATLSAARRTARQMRQLQQLPSDRLNDMGLPSVTDANQRHSGQFGAIPRAEQR